MEKYYAKLQMAGIEFEQYVDMTDVKNSMEIESGTEIAKASRGSVHVSLEVRGEIKIEYKGEYYRHPAEYTDELIEKIRTPYFGVYAPSGEDNDDAEGDLYVHSNNWFEVFIWDEDINPNAPDTFTCDVEGETVTDIFDLLKDAIEEEEGRECHKLDMTIYCSSTPFYTQKECDEDNLCTCAFPKYLVRKYFEAIKTEGNARCDDFEEWLKEYTADDTEGLYEFAKNLGFVPDVDDDRRAVLIACRITDCKGYDVYHALNCGETIDEVVDIIKSKPLDMMEQLIDYISDIEAA